MSQSTTLQAQGHSLEELFSRELPPQSEQLLADYLARTRGRHTVYLSTPITTGLPYVRWLTAQSPPTRGMSDDAIRTAVVKENLERLEPLREFVRAHRPHSAIIDPTELSCPEWTQADYHRFWCEVVRRIADEVVFADGWQFSTGCAYEMAVARAFNVPILDARLERLSEAEIDDLLHDAAEELTRASLSSTAANVALELNPAKRRDTVTAESRGGPLKDDRLAALATRHNVAVFASFSPGDAALRHIVTPDAQASGTPWTPRQAIAEIFAASQSGRVNVRTFKPEKTKGNPFYYGLSTVGETQERVMECAAAGYYTIVNETIDIHDGGVSGVSLGGIVEFGPDATPRIVEESDAAQLPTTVAEHILGAVYGIHIDLPRDRSQRYEFSVHPSRVGHRRSHLCVWESEDVEGLELSATVAWPNRFSRMIGDKTYGLMLADSIGLLVPETVVISRRIAPFHFGTPTGTRQWWLRTAPAEPVPGHFTSSPRWVDPFSLLAREDTRGEVASVLSQEMVPSEYSGASHPGRDGDIIEGVPGSGDEFMLGRVDPGELPRHVIDDVDASLRTISQHFGPVRMEWAHDGKRVWILQLHKARRSLQHGVISPGDANEWLEFDPQRGLEALRVLITEQVQSGQGILVTRPVGVTSHIGDVLRKAGVPARFQNKT